jgi:hypothetical protein
MEMSNVGTPTDINIQEVEMARLLRLYGELDLAVDALGNRFQTLTLIFFLS